MLSITAPGVGDGESGETGVDWGDAEKNGCCPTGAVLEDNTSDATGLLVC